MKEKIFDVIYDISRKVANFSACRSVVLHKFSCANSPDERYYYKRFLSVYDDEILFLTSILDRLNKIIDGGKDHKE